MSLWTETGCEEGDRVWLRRRSIESWDLSDRPCGASSRRESECGGEPDGGPGVGGLPGDSDTWPGLAVWEREAPESGERARDRLSEIGERCGRLSGLWAFLRAGLRV